ncbi:MAG: molybdate ABC transporter substrate-binding protein [Gemmatimonadetes bacterium]|jgi:molybdate transport system substrate-binding protein|nr:molybdate ABC transporter substrate-binding protein [Gemmatimonadota bacterium]MBT5587606.1 molybdate ABC transporter substrate-binding protein [Gemmatimonadota bacterium]MBT6626984.1 molybdate ABC transporter substrate-binding protein [Gemmatimonadota bacterium]MBT7594274.1 molybdate ABC transporter substrate-binding protein [Gemmatimonadota bacterium]
MKNRYCMALIALLGSSCTTPAEETVVISAASSLTYALQDLTEAYRDGNGNSNLPSLRLNFGATGALAQQIREGAPVDLFFAADARELDLLRTQGHLTPDELLFNGQLVIWCRPNAPCAQSLADLDQARIKRIAIAHPQIAPYGAAAIAAMTRADLYTSLAPRLIQGQTARAALRYAETGDADAALTAQSLAQSIDGIWVAVDDSLYPPIEQGVAIVQHAPQPDAAHDFLDFVRSATGRRILATHGFEPQ